MISSDFWLSAQTSSFWAVRISQQFRHGLWISKTWETRFWSQIWDPLWPAPKKSSKIDFCVISSDFFEFLAFSAQNSFVLDRKECLAVLSLILNLQDMRNQILISKFGIRLEVLAKTKFRDLSTGFRISKRMGSAGRNRNRPGPFLVCVFSRDTHV